MQIRNAVVIVTGAAAGIGAALCERFAAGSERCLEGMRRLRARLYDGAGE